MCWCAHIGMGERVLVCVCICVIICVKKRNIFPGSYKKKFFFFYSKQELAPSPGGSPERSHCLSCQGQFICTLTLSHTSPIWDNVACCMVMGCLTGIQYRLQLFFSYIFFLLLLLAPFFLFFVLLLLNCK